jgi:hypothetical protein
MSKLVTWQETYEMVSRAKRLLRTLFSPQASISPPFPLPASTSMHLGSFRMRSKARLYTAVLLSPLKTSSQRTVATPPVMTIPKMTTPRFADCCVVRAPLSRHDSSDQGTRPVSLVMVTLLRTGPGAEVVDELVAVRSCVHACIDRKPMREVRSLGRTRSDCILLFDMNDLFLARLSL